MMAQKYLGFARNRWRRQSWNMGQGNAAEAEVEVGVETPLSLFCIFYTFEKCLLSFDLQIYDMKLDYRYIILD